MAGSVNQLTFVYAFVYTVETGYKNFAGNRKNVLIKGIINMGMYRDVSSVNVLITGFHCIPGFNRN